MKTIPVRGYYRAYSHLPLWDVLDRARIWQEVGLDLTSFEFCESSTAAEDALFSGRVDFLSGNHISPYMLVARGKPIVSLTSPGNGVSDRLVTRERIASVIELRGKRIADTVLEDPVGGFHHPRGNHMLYLLHAGLAPDDVEWLELSSPEARFEAIRSGRADATFPTGGVERFTEIGCHTMELGRLPMINGPTLTSSLWTLREKEGLAERLVRAQILGIHFVKTRRAETEKILAALAQRVPESNPKYASVARIPSKPYPDPQAVVNAHEMCCIRYPEAKSVSPLALWDLHYLRELDSSGFIDELYGEQSGGSGTTSLSEPGEEA